MASYKKPIMASEIKTEEQFEQVMAEGRPIIFEGGIGPAPKGGLEITVDEAIEIAKEVLECERVTLSETSEVYIAAVYRENGAQGFGEMPISIDKKTGYVAVVVLPSDEGFRIIDGCTFVRVG